MLQFAFGFWHYFETTKVQKTNRTKRKDFKNTSDITVFSEKRANPQGYALKFSILNCLRRGLRRSQFFTTFVVLSRFPSSIVSRYVPAG